MSIFDPQTLLPRLGHGPGVYCMYAGDKLIYVGKARDLRRRLGSYFGKRVAGAKTAAMLRRLDRVEVTHTANEVEALLLEATLIKHHRPRYNVVLRDDKSYPVHPPRRGAGLSASHVLSRQRTRRDPAFRAISQRRRRACDTR